MKLKENPQLHFDKINDEKNSKKMDLNMIETDDFTEEDNKLFEKILELDESNFNLEKENYTIKQNLEKNKNEFANFASKLFKNFNNDLNEIYEDLSDNLQLQKILLGHFYSLINLNEMTEALKYLHINISNFLLIIRQL